MSQRWIQKNFQRYTLISIVTGLGICLAILLLADAEGNPGDPQVNPPPVDLPGGGSVPYANVSLLFISENVTVRLEEMASVQADYTIENPSNVSVETNIFLPFHFLQKKPESLIIRREDHILNYTWTNYTLPDMFSRYINYEAVNFSLDFHPNERATINVSYSRDYISNAIYEKDRFSRAPNLDSHISCYVYLARTGALWSDPIQYAKFQFIIPRNIATVNLSEDNLYSLYYHKWYGYYPVEGWYPVKNAHENAEFLWEHQFEDDTHLYLTKEYRNWTPARDIGIVWEIPHPHPSHFNITYNDSTKSCNFTFDGIAMQGYDVNNSDFSWKVNDVFISNEPVIQFVFPSKGSYTISLNVTCEFGYTMNIVKTIDVSMVNEPITLLASDYYWYRKEPMDDARWDMGDGSTYIGALISHSYSHPGMYLVNISYKPNNRYYWTNRSTVLYIMDIDSDADGILDSYDAFPLDPAASIDKDADGKPEEWNPGMSEKDSTTGLQLDEPDDLNWKVQLKPNTIVMTALILIIFICSIVMRKRDILFNH